MASPNIVQGDQVVTGQLVAQGGFVPPAGSIGDAAIAAAAGLSASKLQHEHRKSYAQESATAAADEARVLHTVRGAAGTIKSFVAGAVVPAVGDAIVEIDLLKDGVSVLDAAIEVNVAHAAYEVVAGTIDTPTVAAGDVLEVSIDGTIGTGTLAKGVFCELSVREDAET